MLDSLRTDAAFGWRQLWKKKATSAAAILSLAVAIGACTSAFRLVDALLLRPLPVAEPERLYSVAFEGMGRNGKLRTWDSCSYPMFREWRGLVKGQAELIAISYTERADVTFGSDREMEKAYRQFVSGWMFGSFGVRPVLGRVLTERDDLQLGAHPYAVLSYDYWRRRFGGDRNAVGRTFRMGNRVYEIVGVAQEGFNGTEPGAMTDVFFPTMMQANAVTNNNSFWLRTFVRPQRGVELDALREKLYADYVIFERERAKANVSFSGSSVVGENKDRLLLASAAAGVSGMQKDYRLALAAMGVLVALVLLIACANVANLMTVEAAARTREMALRISIGAGRWRLIQLVLMQSAWLGLLSAASGGLFAWWSAPLVVRMINPPDNPARLVLPADWRVLMFGMALTMVVTFLFGLAPALRASSVKPASALKGGEDPHSRRRLMHALVAAQAAFCFLVLFVAGLFTTTFERLSKLPTGFSAERLLTLETVTANPQASGRWEQTAERLRSVTGVESVAISAWPLMSGEMRNNRVTVAGAPPSDVLAFFLSVTPRWTDTMKIPLRSGRDFRPNDSHPGVAIVNETFAKTYFGGRNPVGQSFVSNEPRNAPTRYEIVGLTADAVYRDVREPMLPVIYVPFASTDAQGMLQPKNRATFNVRTVSGNPLALAPALREEAARAGFGFRVSNIRTQTEIDESQTVRERLLAVLALFFGMVAVLLAGVGLYGVLDYSVLQRRREIGIRRAVGAQGSDIAWNVTADVFGMLLAGAAAGLVLGMAGVKYVETLLYGVKASDPVTLAIPALTIAAAALLAAVPAVLHAVKIDPASMLRSE
jgi:predicted permease